jgi:hypothetical protein
MKTEPKATPSRPQAETEPVRATPSGSVAFDSTMIGQTLASGPGTVTGLVLVKPGSTTPAFDNVGNPVDGMLKLPGVVSMYAKDMAGGATAKAMSVPFSGALVLAACPNGGRWSITTA